VGAGREGASGGLWVAIVFGRGSFSVEVVKSELRCKVYVRGRKGECFGGSFVSDVPAIVVEVFLDEVILNKPGAVVRTGVSRRGKRKEKGRYCLLLADGEG
jgi:hypothetical protein